MSSNFEMFSVTENRTGRRVCVCGNEQDAIMMVALDPDYRSYSRDRFILDQIVNVSYESMEPNKQLKDQKILQKGEGQPVIV